MKRQLIIILAALFSLFPMLGTGAASAVTLAAPAKDGPPTQAFHLGDRAGGEIPSLRTRTSRTYSHDGYYVTQISTDSLDYQDSSGAWQPIDDSLIPATGTGFAYQNKANRYTARFPSDIGQSPVLIQTSGGWISFTLATAHGTGTVSGNTDTYSIPGASIALAAESDSLKESITLQSPSSPSTVTWTVHTSPGVALAQNPAGGIDVQSPSGQIVFSLTPPFMTDAAGATSNNVTMALSTSGTTTTVTETADPSWLADPARSYPVVIDPSVSIGASNICTIGNGSHAAVLCTSPAQVGYANGYASRTLLNLNLAGTIPGNAEILNADLALPLAAAYSTTAQEVDAYALTQAWTYPQATWNKYNTTSSWVTPGGDYTTMASVKNTAVGPALQTYHLYPTALVQSFVNGMMTNDGLLLREPNETATDGLKFNAPTLTVTYVPALGSQRFNSVVAGAQLDDRMDIGVNPINGNLLLHESDVAIPGVGLPLAIDRYFNGLASSQSELGNGWLLSTGADIGLSIFGDGSLDFHGPSGYQIPFLINADGSYTAPTGIDSTLVKNSDGSYTLTENASSLKLTFSSGGVLTSEVDTSNNKLTFNYSGSQLASITDTQGRTTSFTYTSGLLTKVTDPAGHSYSYAYDANKNLTSYTDPAGKQTTFAYDASGNITTITDPNGVMTGFTYDSSRRVTAVIRNWVTTGHNGPTTTLSYNSWTTTVTDPNGHSTTYGYDAYGRVTQMTDPNNNTWLVNWNADSQVNQTTEPNGATSSTTYDSLNRVTAGTDALGITQTASYGNASHPYLPTATTDNLGNTTSVQYNSAGLPTSATDPLGDTASATYNGNGTPATATDPNNSTTSMSYTNGLPTKVTPPSPLGSQSATYTAANLPATTTDGRGDVSTYSYDSLNRLTGATYADHTSHGYAYDADGNLLSETDSGGTTTFSYDALNQLVTQHLPTNQNINYVYDLAGQLTSKTDAGGTTSYTYDAAGNQLTMSDRQSHLYQYTYDAEGYVTSVTLPGGAVENITYDADHHITLETITKPGGQPLTYFTTSYTDPTTLRQVLHPTSYSDWDYTYAVKYDSAGHILELDEKSSSAGDNHTFLYHYDADGHMIEETEDGVVIYQLSYNAAGEPTLANGAVALTFDNNGNVLTTSGGDSYSYNAANQITSTNGSAASQSATTFTMNGNTYTIDANGEIDSIVGTSGTIYMTYAADGVPFSASINGGTYYFLTDANGSILSVLDSNYNTVENCTYDPVTEKSNRSGSFGQPPTGYEGDINIGGGLLIDPSAGLIDTSLGVAVQDDGGTQGNQGDGTIFLSATPYDPADSSAIGCGRGYRCKLAKGTWCFKDNCDLDILNITVSAWVRYGHGTVTALAPACDPSGLASTKVISCVPENQGGKGFGFLVLSGTVEACSPKLIVNIKLVHVSGQYCAYVTIDVRVFLDGSTSTTEEGL